MHRALAQAARRPLAAAGTRAFNSAPVARAIALDSDEMQDASSFHHADHYAKDEHTYEPVANGTTHYVVSEPEVKTSHYDVPHGAFPTSSPYDNYPATEAPSTSEPLSSSSASTAHPNTTQRAQSGELASRNAWPSEEQGKAGLNEAWKMRK